MKVDSLEELTAAFDGWRDGKRHVREAMPEALVERARRTARVHGVERVARAVRMDGRRLGSAPGAAAGHRRSERRTPGYSRVEMAAPVGVGRPLAELEMPSGVKVRFYSQTEEMLALLSAVCAGGGR